jgi:hypothetical protein
MDPFRQKSYISVLSFFVGLAGIFYFFGIVAVNKYYNFINQGQPNPLTSELPAPPIPPMSVFELLLVLVPALLGLIASAIYIFYPVLKIFFKNSSKLIVNAAWMDVIGRIGIGFFTPILRPLPTISQTITVWVIFIGPFLLCGLFSIWLILLSRKET